MPTLFRRDERTWKYAPYGQSDSLTRAAFREKAALHGMLREGVPQRFACGNCEHEWSFNELGASFGDAAIGTPVCPTDGCTGIGWEYFTEVAGAPSA